MKTYEVVYVDPKTRQLLSTLYTETEGVSDADAVGNALKFAQGLLNEGFVSLIRERSVTAP